MSTDDKKNDKGDESTWRALVYNKDLDTDGVMKVYVDWAEKVLNSNQI